MNTVNFTPNFGTTTATPTTYSDMQSNEFSGIIQQLLANQGAENPTMIDETGMSIQEILLQLFGSGEDTTQGSLEQLLFQYFGVSEEGQANQYGETELDALLMSVGMMPMQTAQTYTESTNLLDQLLEQTESSSATYTLLQVISQLSATDQKNFIQNILNNPVNSSSINSSSDLSAAVVNQLFPIANTATTASTANAENIQQLINLLGSDVTATQYTTQQANSMESFTDSLTRMQITNAIQPTSQTGDAGEETLNLEQLQQSLATVNDSSTVNANNVFNVVNSNDTSLSTSAKVQDIALQLNQGMQNLSQTREFTVKLSPEGLGEITVSLTETAGKMSLVLTATSVETAKLLNSEMATLQSTLKSFQTESEPIILVQTSQSETENDYLFNAFSQQERNEQFFARSNVLEGEESQEPEEQESLAQVTSNILSARI